MATPTVCSFNKFGHCKYKESCRKPHFNELCDVSSCDFLSCKLRHPKKCNWYSEYGRCKFNPCSFKHTDEIDSVDSARREMAKITSKLKSIETSLTNLEAEERKINSTIDKIKEENENKFNNFEKLLAEKDDRIRNLEQSVEKKFEMFEKSLNSLKQCVAEKDLYIEKLEQRLTSKPDKDIIKIQCSKCDYEGNSKHGLKVHMAKKHTTIEKINSNKCDLCEEEFRNCNDLKRHMKSHSFKQASFKCLDCEFVGANQITMAVHIGKSHTEKYECGLCNFESETFEKLETHLFTCENYMCDACKTSETSISNIKKHIEESHRPHKNFMLFHNKLDRNNQEEVCCNVLYWSDI